MPCQPLQLSSGQADGEREESLALMAVFYFVAFLQGGCRWGGDRDLR